MATGANRNPLLYSQSLVLDPKGNKVDTRRDVVGSGHTRATTSDTSHLLLRLLVNFMDLPCLLVDKFVSLHQILFNSSQLYSVLVKLSQF